MVGGPSENPLWAELIAEKTGMRVRVMHGSYAGAVGAAGWLVYSLASRWGATVAEATFFATVLVILLSRIFAVRERCPATIFVICGIFPLVPGAGIYWTAYYLVTNQLSDALSSGFAAVKAAIALVLGIVVVFELPHKWFRLASKRQP